MTNNTAKSRTKLAGFDGALQAPVEDLVKALRRLGPGQGRIARQGARRALQDAVSKLWRQVDDMYPVERKTPKKRRRRSPVHRINELAAKGWVPFPEPSSYALLKALAAAGIRIRRMRVPVRGTHGVASVEQLWAPSWAILVAAHRPSELAACRRGIRRRRALLVEIALKTGGAP